MFRNIVKNEELDRRLLQKLGLPRFLVTRKQAERIKEAILSGDAGSAKSIIKGLAIPHKLEKAIDAFGQCPPEELQLSDAIELIHLAQWLKMRERQCYDMGENSSAELFAHLRQQVKKLIYLLVLGAIEQVKKELEEDGLEPPDLPDEEEEEVGKALPPKPREDKPLEEHRIPHAHRTPPKEYAEEGAKDPEDYADPRNFKYPLHTPENVRNALARFSNPDNRKGYTEDEQKTMWRRMVRAAKRFGIEVADDILEAAGYKGDKE
jgi:hypothetical protein